MFGYFLWIESRKLWKSHYCMQSLVKLGDGSLHCIQAFARIARKQIESGTDPYVSFYKFFNLQKY